MKLRYLFLAAVLFAGACSRPSDGDVRAGWFGAAGNGPGKGVYGFFGREVCLNHTVCC